MKELTAAERWSLNHFAMLAEGGVWAVPRSGLLFSKRGKELVLVARMPYTAELAAASRDGRDVPTNPGVLSAYQDQDYAIIARTFEGAGIPVRSTC